MKGYDAEDAEMSGITVETDQMEISGLNKKGKEDGSIKNI